MTAETNRKSNKGGTIFTYVIALLCLIAGLFAPLYGNGELVDKMLFFYLPEALNAALGQTILSMGWAKAFTETYELTIFGNYCNIFAWSIVVYALVTVLGIIFLIPVLAGSKNKSTSARAAYFIEVLAALALTVYILFKLFLLADASWSSYNLLIAYGGVVLMLIIQSLMNKKNMGFCKVLLFLLSILATIALFNVTVWIVALATPIENLASSLGLKVGFTTMLGAEYFFNYVLAIQNIGTLLADMTVNYKVLTIVAMIVSLLVVFNLIIDTIGLATGSKYDRDGIIKVNKGAKVFTFFRYLLEILAIIVVIIMMLVVKETVGIYLYALAIIAIIQLVIATIRVCRIKSTREKAKKARETNEVVFEDEQFDPDAIIEQYELQQEAENADVTEVYEEPADYTEDTDQQVVVVDDTDNTEVQPVVEEQTEEPTQVYIEPDTEVQDEEVTPAPVVDEQPDKEETHTYVYNVKTVYNGPTDKFLDTLTDPEKVEFVKVFVEKSKGNLPNIPDYEIGGENTQFFPSVFIYLGKIRTLISKELLSKIYKQLNLIN